MHLSQKKWLSGSLEAAKNIFVKSIVNDLTKHDIAVIIVFFTELFEVKRGRGSWNKLFAGSRWESILDRRGRIQYLFKQS